MTDGHEGSALLDELGRLWASVDPVPPDLTDRIKTAMTVQQLHAELAELTSAPALVARAEPERTDVLTFAATTLSLMVNVGRHEGLLVLDGWVTAGGSRVELHHGRGMLTTDTDERGRFVFRDVARGPVRFVVHPPAELADRPVVTPTVEL